LSTKKIGYLKKLNSILGLPAVSAVGGKKLGSIADMVFMEGQSSILGLVLIASGFFGKKIYVPFSSVRIIGEHAVILEGDEDMIGKSSAKAPMEGILYANRVLGYRIIGDNGIELGNVSDLILNVDEGRIEGYEISKGFIDDLVDGRSVLPSCGENILDGNTIVVSLHQLDEILSYDKGIKSLLNIDNKSKAQNERMDGHDDKKQVYEGIFSGELVGDSSRGIFNASFGQRIRQEDNE
jgi:uncharacterized protein YrrD